MAKFKEGDRVVSLKEDSDYGIKYYGYGNIQNISSGESMLVLWDEAYGDRRWWVNGNDLALASDYEPTQIQLNIPQIIEQSKQNSWDDSVEINELVDLPLDKFSFTHRDQYGRELTHKLELNEGQYDLTDVIASFRLFLFGVGYDREDVDEIIDESRL